MHPLLSASLANGARAAIVSSGKTFTFSELLRSSLLISRQLQQSGTTQRVIATFMPNNFEHVASIFAIWHAGHAALPLYPSHPPSDLRYFLEDSKCSRIIAHPSLLSQIKAIAPPEVSIVSPVPGTPRDDADPDLIWKPFQPDANALLIYTSGTTARPKAVVHTHASMLAQLSSLKEAWQMSPSDRLLHMLPLHHVHGLINALLLPLYSGSTVEFLNVETNNRTFDAAEVWNRFLNADKEPRVSVMMGVPVMYAALLSAFKKMQPSRQNTLRAAFQKQIRVCISGSSALPTTLFEEWTNVIWEGHTDDERARLLERYGMTEIGMALSNPLHGPRIPGTVGTPLPGVEAKLVNEEGIDVTSEAEPVGELWIRSPSVFKEYLNKSAEKEFSADGWFKTGDCATRYTPHAQDSPVYKILGRISVDILKVKGYKISALEIERVLLESNLISEAAVFGVESADAAIGDEIVAVVAGGENGRNLVEKLKLFLKDRLAHYKMPKIFKIVDELPRNAIGKVDKKKLKLLHKAN